MRKYNNKVTVPMNGWRTRELAEYYFGDKKYANRFCEGVKVVLPIGELTKLPGWDTANTEYLDSFHGEVILTVQYEERSYGMHCSVEQVKTYNEMSDAYSHFGDYLVVVVTKGNDTYASAVKLYFRDVRKEDLIMSFNTLDIKYAVDLQDGKDRCQGYVCDNDLIYRLLQLHGDVIKAKLVEACVI